MGLIHRLTDILSSNVNELLEKYENPDLLLKQALREMDQAIGAALEDAAKVVAHEKILARELSAEESAVDTSRQRAESAARRGDDQAAREALRRKRDHQGASAALASQLRETTLAAQSLREQVHGMRVRTEEAKRKLALLSARNRAAQARKRLLREFSAVPAREQSFQKFERMCRKVERTEAEADALSELLAESGNRRELAGEGADAECEAIDAELREIKAKCGA